MIKANKIVIGLGILVSIVLLIFGILTTPNYQEIEDKTELGEVCSKMVNSLPVEYRNSSEQAIEIFM
ncbi:unnamed protein product, partial [marine sediment metagenome]